MTISMHRDQRRRPWGEGVWSAVLMLLLAGCGASFAAEAQTPELELRLEAAFLFNFAKFIEWPAGASVPGSFTFCVLGDEPVYRALGESLAGKTINGRALVARQTGSPQDTLPCQIAFIGSAEKKRLPEVLDALAGVPILTVSDFESFARRGGMIQLTKEGNKFRFAINVDAVNRHGLRVSSKLLQLAEVVHEPDMARSKP